MLTLASFIDTKSARLKYEGLSCIAILMAGQPSNCFHQLMKDHFGYSSASTHPTETGDEGESQVSQLEEGTAAPGDRPLKKRPHAMASGSESGKEANPPPLEASHATLFKPGPDDQRWTKTGLSQEYLLVKGDNEYGCPFPKCGYVPRQKLDLVCTHIRRHLNIGIGCHHCEKGYWSAEGWKRHCRNIHPDLPKVPEGAEEPEAFENPLGDDPKITEIDIEQEEADAIDQAIQSGRTSGSLAVEPQFLEVLEEIPTSSTTVCTTTATSTTSIITPMDT